MLRYVSETEATIWVETSQECQVGILGRTARTFEVAGHHYGLVMIEGLAPGSAHEYQVTLDAVVRWPLPDSGFPPSVLRTLSQDRPARLAFGSCRVAEIALKNLDRSARRQRAMRQSAGAQPATQEQAGRQGAAGGPASAEGIDALAACAASLVKSSPESWPDVLLMIGDQVYADEPGPATREFMASHRAAQSALGAPSAPAAPPGEVADFAEYCALYWEAWSDPAARWLFSVIPTVMIFDDHDVHDDWNTSASWRRAFAAQPWWGRRIESAYQSYWVYQHLGNLSPQQLAADETWEKVRQPGDAAPVLADLARRADQRSPDIRWSVARTFSAAGGTVRLILLDSRSRRVVDPGGRLMADEREWQWLRESLDGDWQHVVIGTSVPPLLPRGIHTLEAWTERLADGAWGRWAAGFAERLRDGVDLEHWPAFGASFAKLEQLVTELAIGRHSPQGNPPASVTLISGDIHHSYLAVVDLPRHTATAATATRTSAVYEAVCSPFHQAIPPKMRYAQQLASSKVSGLLGTAAAMLARAHVPRLTWRITEGPWFENMIATLEYRAARATVRFDHATADQAGEPCLTTVAEADLS
jgi:hypothetical protein